MVDYHAKMDDSDGVSSVRHFVFADRGCRLQDAAQILMDDVCGLDLSILLFIVWEECSRFRMDRRNVGEECQIGSGRNFNGLESFVTKKFRKF